MRQFTLLGMAFGLMMSMVSFAAAHCCEQCGAEGCRKICRVVCEKKKTPHTTFSCECEDFCIADRSCKCGYRCEVDCDGYARKVPNFVPTTARMRTKMKLVKKVEEKETVHYKWEVVYLCDRCCAEGEQCR